MIALNPMKSLLPEVEQLISPFLFRGDRNIDSLLSYVSEDAPYYENDKGLDLQTAYNMALEDLTKTKKSNIKLKSKLKLFNEKMLLLQRCESQMKDLLDDK